MAKKSRQFNPRRAQPANAQTFSQELRFVAVQAGGPPPPPKFPQSMVALSQFLLETWPNLTAP